MPDSITVQLIMAIGISNVFLYVFIDRWMYSRADAIATGLVGGVSVSSKYRRLLFIFSWVTAFAVGIGAQSVYTVGYLLLSRNASTETVRGFAELQTFFSFVGAANWLAQAPFWVLHFRSTLREAERA